MQKLKAVQQDQSFELDLTSFQKRKENIVKSVLTTLRDDNTSTAEKNRRLKEVIADLREQRKRIEYIHTQVHLSIVSGAANDTHH